MTRRRTSPARGTSPRREPAGPRESQAWLAARGGSHSAPMCVLMLAHREVRPWALTTSHKTSLQRPYSHPLPLLSNKQLLGYAALLFKTGHFVGSPNENSGAGGCWPWFRGSLMSGTQCLSFSRLFFAVTAWLLQFQPSHPNSQQ